MAIWSGGSLWLRAHGCRGMNLKPSKPLSVPCSCTIGAAGKGVHEKHLQEKQNTRGILKHQLPSRDLWQRPLF